MSTPAAPAASLLDTLPLLIALAGLVLYTVLAGADFGAGFWELLAGRGARARRIRDAAHDAIAPVWEANHVWLVLVLVVLWTAYPVFFASVCSTLTVPIFLAALGIVLRGLAYALQSATAVPRERRTIDTAFALSSILTPFMLGAAIGGVASGRVPVGNAAGSQVTSWVNPTSTVAGCLAVATGAYLAAVYLAADARRRFDGDMVAAFRTRALVAGVVAGVLALVGLAVVRVDAPRLFGGLTAGWGLAAVAVSAAAGVVSLALVATWRFRSARIAAAAAVAALLGGWAAAQRPYLLPGLTLAEAAAGGSVLLAVVVSTALGAVVLVPSLALLFRLTLTGRLDAEPAAPLPVHPTRPDARRPAGAGRVAVAALAVGVLLLTLLDGGVAHAFGVLALAVAGVAAFTAIGPDEVAAAAPDRPAARP